MLRARLPKLVEFFNALILLIMKNLYYSIRYSNFISRILYLRKVQVKIISTIIFVVLFFSICGIFELAYPLTIGNEINNLIDKFFWLGVK